MRWRGRSSRALVYNGISHVVMMASPKDLEYFALGFRFPKNYRKPARYLRHGCRSLPVMARKLQIELSSRRFMGLKAARPGGTNGLWRMRNCNASSAVSVSFCRSLNCSTIQVLISPNNPNIPHRLSSILGRYRSPCGAGQTVRPPIQGKLAARCGALSSRASYEMVQKSAMCGVEILLFAVSAATTLAVEVAERCNLTLVGFVNRVGRRFIPIPQRLVHN